MIHVILHGGMHMFAQRQCAVQQELLCPVLDEWCSAEPCTSQLLATHFAGEPGQTKGNGGKASAKTGKENAPSGAAVPSDCSQQAAAGGHMTRSLPIRCVTRARAAPQK